MHSIVLFAAAFIFSVGIAVLWANAARFINQAFCLSSVVYSIWFAIVYESIAYGHIYIGSAVPWLRADAALAALAPWTIALLKESIAVAPGNRRQALVRSAPWAVFALPVALICY